MGGAGRTPTAPKLRNVLAMLIVHADQVVPVTALMRELWDDEPPASGLTTLQTYILNLRKLLAALTRHPTARVAETLLLTRAGGYQLTTAHAGLDLNRYHEHAGAGRRALAAGDHHGALTHLTEALNLWRGPALVDIPTGRILESKRRQYEESRLVLLEYLLDTQLHLGMYHEALTELAALTTQNPLHEGLHAQYMRALHLAGRRAQALETFHSLRTTLVTELGLDPGPAIQRLHHAILNNDPQLHTSLTPPPADTIPAGTWTSTRSY
ncbi:transcriptional regulator [Marinitenerispora sediminis]|uniref:Transcriptional regulator n=2 Tax=Marinitenerispora sediminis TaxID=1931232 RepID=A0A368SYY2_9ACTN|nr:transcriptional regulator [Marinitenerispora sediminis]RCV48322.1 transcriptional regulator [Marinitenerispora sediminis]RCV50078.1 transcriptional regulator [Marinitenerispora sediminis]